MNRVRLILVAGFVLAFAAGAVVGVLVGSDKGDRAVRPPGPGPHLARELDLSPRQQAQMREIWAEVMGPAPGQQSRQRWQELRRRRTERIEALLTDEQQQQYKQILADHDREMEAVRQERHQAVQRAVERTKAILTESQAKKYEALRKDWRRRPGRGSRGPGRFLSGRRSRPRTQRAAHPTPQSATGPSQP